MTMTMTINHEEKLKDELTRLKTKLGYAEREQAFALDVRFRKSCSEFLRVSPAG